MNQNKLLKITYLIVSSCLGLVGAKAVAATSSSAQSPIVFDQFDQRVEIERDGTSTVTSSVVIRPLSPAGAQAMAAIPFPVSPSLQTFTLLESWVEAADGQRTPLDPKTMIVQASPFTMQAPTLTDMEVRVLPIPRLGVGGTLHIASKMQQTKPFFPGNAYFAAFDVPWVQRKASRVTITAPADLPLFIENVDWTKQAERRDGGRVTMEFTRSAQAFVPPQPSATAPIDWAPRLIVSTFPDWPTFAKAYQDRATPREAATPEIRALAAEITKGARTDKDKTIAITRWVRDNIRYVNIILDVGGFVPTPASEVLNKRFGDCKGHVTLAMALLGAAGVQATPALVSLDPIYREPAVATQVFNHVVVHVPKLGMFIDTTGRYVEPGEIPRQLEGKFALLTRTGTMVRIPRLGVEATGKDSRFDLTVAPDGTISGTSEISARGTERPMMRGRVAAMASADRAQLAAQLLSANGSPGNGSIAGTADGLGMTGQFTLSTPLELTAPGATRLPYTLTDTSIEGISRQGSSEPMRTPWSCAPSHYVERFTMRFPDSVAIVSVPRDTRIDTPLIRYTSTYRTTGQQVEAVREYQSLYPNPSCTPEEFQQAGETKRLIARDTAAQIMFAPKATSGR